MSEQSEGGDQEYDMDFDMFEIAKASRMHLCYRPLVTSYITGKNSNRINKVSDRFDDVHQEFLITHTHPVCIKV